MYDLDEFVNETTISGKFVDMYDPDKLNWSDDELFNVYPAKFEKMFKFDTRNEQAFPVFVYELEGEPVAWWDCENVSGKIAKGCVQQN